MKSSEDSFVVEVSAALSSFVSAGFMRSGDVFGFSESFGLAVCVADRDFSAAALLSDLERAYTFDGARAFSFRGDGEVGVSSGTVRAAGVLGSVRDRFETRAVVCTVGSTMLSSLCFPSTSSWNGPSSTGLFGLVGCDRARRSLSHGFAARVFTSETAVDIWRGGDEHSASARLTAEARGRGDG